MDFAQSKSMGCGSAGLLMEVEGVDGGQAGDGVEGEVMDCIRVMVEFLGIAA